MCCCAARRLVTRWAWARTAARSRRGRAAPGRARRAPGHRSPGRCAAPSNHRIRLLVLRTARSAARWPPSPRPSRGSPRRPAGQLGRRPAAAARCSAARCAPSAPSWSALPRSAARRKARVSNADRTSISSSMSARGERAHDGPGPRPRGDQPLRHQLAQRIPHRDPADRHLGREVSLDQSRSGRPGTVDDLLAQDRGHPLGLGREGRRRLGAHHMASSPWLPGWYTISGCPVLALSSLLP